jgi:hypothetical protein
MSRFVGPVVAVVLGRSPALGQDEVVRSVDANEGPSASLFAPLSCQIVIYYNNHKRFSAAWLSMYRLVTAGDFAPGFNPFLESDRMREHQRSRGERRIVEQIDDVELDWDDYPGRQRYFDHFVTVSMYVQLFTVRTRRSMHTCFG